MDKSWDIIPPEEIEEADGDKYGMRNGRWRE